MANSARIFLVGALLAPALLSGCAWPGESEALPSSASAHSPSAITSGVTTVRHPAGESVSSSVPAQAGASLQPSSLLPSASAQAQVPATTDSAFAQCRRELNSLRLIAPAAYTRRKAEFDQLINRAAVYARVRGDINNQTQDAVDALYQYQTRQLCIRIQRDVVDGLLLRAGSGDGKA